jgi:hypothetical protein
MDPVSLHLNAAQHPASHPSSEKPKKNEPEHPAERFISGDMAQMLEDIKRVDPSMVASARQSDDAGHSATPDRDDAPAAGERFVSADMAQMLEDIERAEASFVESDEASKPAGEAPPRSSAHLDEVDPGEVLVEADEESVEPHFGHSRQHLASRTLTGVSLGIESAEAGGILVQSAATAADHTGKIAAEALAGSAAHHTSAAVNHTAAAVHHTGVATGLLAGCAAASGVVAAGMTVLGAHSLYCGIRDRDTEKILEGTGETILGAKSAASALTMAAHGATEGLLGTVAHGAHMVLTPLGVAHGLIDITLGIKKITEARESGSRGQLLEGMLEIGQGMALGASVLGGGLPAIGIATVCFGSKIYVQHRNKTHGGTEH